MSFPVWLSIAIAILSFFGWIAYAACKGINANGWDSEIGITVLQACGVAVLGYAWFISIPLLALSAAAGFTFNFFKKRRPYGK